MSHFVVIVSTSSHHTLICTVEYKYTNLYIKHFLADIKVESTSTFALLNLIWFIYSSTSRWSKTIKTLKISHKKTIAWDSKKMKGKTG